MFVQISYSVHYTKDQILQTLEQALLIPHYKSFSSFKMFLHNEGAVNMRLVKETTVENTG